MKLLRSITRRGFNLGTAGWFTVLKPNTWFPASRLPGSFQSRASLSTLDHPQNIGTATSPRIAIPIAEARRPMHLALIVLAAVAITSALLWWIMHP